MSTNTEPSQMSSGRKRVFGTLLDFANSWRASYLSSSSSSSRSSPGRRVMHRDVEQEEFHFSTARCLSSYYSVFVVRLAIMVMLAILIGMLTILTWHFTRSYTIQSVDTLASGLRYEILQRPILRMWNILNATSEVTTAQVKLSQYVIRRYSNPAATQAEQVELYEVMRDVTWALFASRKALNAITINYKNGFVQAFHRDNRSNNTFYIYSNVLNYSIRGDELSSSIRGNVSAIWYREPLDPVTGEKIGKASPILPDDLINIAGLSQVPDGVASWHVAVSKHTNSPLLSAALPVWDANNKSIVAVVGVTTALASVGELMRELVEVHSGHIIYLTSQEGYLLATSRNTPLLRNSSKGPNLIMAVDSEDFTIRTGAQWLEKVYGNKFAPGHVQVGDAKLGHQKYYVDSFFLNLKRLPILGVILIPRTFIMGKIDERAFKTLVILIAASLCIFFIGCVCILILTNGVSKEMNLRAELISHLDARRRAEASSNYKSQFLANMSHELRTPMAAVIGLLDILISDDCLTNEQYATVTQIRKCSTALLRLLNNILDLSKVESGKLVLEDAEFDLGRELEGLIDMFSVQCINHNVEAVLDLSDDMPKLVRGDSARVVQIFANLISNSIKFTPSGHIILRGWCESLDTCDDSVKCTQEQRKIRCSLGPKLRQQGNHTKKASKKENKVILRFEIDDTGCGIDPSKWESVFESFEQADPSTTRLHGGTGLGLCIVRTLVRKMGGEIKVLKKNGLGNLMQLYLILSTPLDSGDQHNHIDYSTHNFAVLLASYGRTGRAIMSQWLRKIGLSTLEASEWNELTQVLHELFRTKSRKGFHDPRSQVLELQDMRNRACIIVIDIGLLDLSTDIWKQQVSFLNRFSGKVKFVWMLNHDTSNPVKMELRSKGHMLMVNKPLYKEKMIQILETVVKERNLEQQKRSFVEAGTIREDGNTHDCLEIDTSQFDTVSFEDSEQERQKMRAPLHHQAFRSSFVEMTEVHHEDNCSRDEHVPPHSKLNLHGSEDEEASFPEEQGGYRLRAATHSQKALQGLRILLAEDNPVLQRVATIMLEKMGAAVVAVGDGLQAVDALNYRFGSNGSPLREGNTNIQAQTRNTGPYDLILMDCQMPKMDGYEATRAIRSAEAGTGQHIPIVALTAHAMSSDEAKCLEVGMDAYLTKPIDYSLMVSTILSFTKTT